MVVTEDGGVLGSVSLEGQQVAPPQAHGPGTVPDRPVVTGQDDVFDLQLAVLKRRRETRQ